MEVEFDIGAKLDIATGKDVDSLKDEIKKGWPSKPIYDSRIVAASAPAAGEWFLDLGSPDVGRVWNVLGCTIVGSDDSTTVAGKVALYFGDSDTPSLMSVKVPGMVVPSFQGFSDKVLWCHSTANVVAGITGVTAGLQVMVAVHFANWMEKDVSAWSTR